MSAVPQEVIPPRKLDLGCGKNKKQGFLGVDSRPFEGVDYVWDVRVTPWRLVNIEYVDTHERVDGMGAAITIGLADKEYAAKEWPIIESDSIEEVHCSHMVEHLDASERIHFANELHRVLKKGAKASIITPHFASVRAYGDLTHKWPPVVSFWYLYLNAEWRKANAPHNDEYTCDFDHGYGFGLHPTVQARNQEYQNYAVIHLLEGAQDLHVTLTKR